MIALFLAFMVQGMPQCHHITVGWLGSAYQALVSNAVRCETLVHVFNT